MNECMNIILSDTILSVYHFVHTILSVPFCPYHFVPYHFVLEPREVIVYQSRAEVLGCPEPTTSLDARGRTNPTIFFCHPIFRKNILATIRLSKFLKNIFQSFTQIFEFFPKGFQFVSQNPLDHGCPRLDGPLTTSFGTDG